MSGIFDQCRKLGFLKYGTHAFIMKETCVASATTSAVNSKTASGAVGIVFFLH